MEIRSVAEDIRKHAESWRKTLLSRLLDAVKQKFLLPELLEGTQFLDGSCQSYFGGPNREVATYEDSRVECLVTEWETIFEHGLLGPSSALTTLKQATTMLVNWRSADDETSWWSCVRMTMSQDEQCRVTALPVHSDQGRGRAWLRLSLNERSLESTIGVLVHDVQLLARFYEPWAFLRDPETAHTLPHIARGLSTIIFSLQINSAELDSARSTSVDVVSDVRIPPEPMVNLAFGNSKMRSLSTGSESVVNRGVKSEDKRKKPLVNVVSFDDNKAILSESAGQSTVVSSAQSVCTKQENLNPLLSSLIHVWNEPSVVEFDAEHASPLNRSSPPSETIDHLFWEPNNQDRLFRPIGDHSTTELLESNSVCSLQLKCDSESRPDSNLSESRSDTGQCVMVTEKIKSRDEHSSLGQLRANLEPKSSKESSRQQLEHLEENYRIQLDVSSGLKETDRIALYETKLAQMAEMHAELVELNERLVHRLNRRKMHINRLRRELCTLKGPLLDEFSDDDLVGFPDCRPCVNLRLPTAFLSGKGNDVYHVYQVYIVLGHEEWNVYRRYSDLLTFHRQLSKQDSYIAKLPFPPKKSVGRNEKSFVEERRKALECYLRISINHIVTTYPEFTSVPINRDSLCRQVPLLRTKL